MGGQCISFYIDNNNALSALIKADSDTVIISFLRMIVWAIFSKRGVTPRLGRVTADFNIADLPPRFPKLHFLCKSKKEFPYRKQHFRAATDGLAENASGFFGADLLVGRFY